MKVYISSSWKQRERVRQLARMLRDRNIDVYDFTDPGCRSTPEIPPEKFPEPFDSHTHYYPEYLERPEWRAAVEENLKTIRGCDALVLLLPCGADAHADYGVAVGLGKPTIVVGHPADGERSPTHLWSMMVDELEGAVGLLNGWKLDGKLPTKLRPAGEHEWSMPAIQQELLLKAVEAGATVRPVSWPSGLEMLMGEIRAHAVNGGGYTMIATAIADVGLRLVTELLELRRCLTDPPAASAREPERRCSSGWEPQVQGDDVADDSLRAQRERPCAACVHMQSNTQFGPPADICDQCGPSHRNWRNQ